MLARLTVSQLESRALLSDTGIRRSQRASSLPGPCPAHWHQRHEHGRFACGSSVARGGSGRRWPSATGNLIEVGLSRGRAGSGGAFNQAEPTRALPVNPSGPGVSERRRARGSMERARMVRFRFATCTPGAHMTLLRTIRLRRSCRARRGRPPSLCPGYLGPEAHCARATASEQPTLH